MEQEVLSWLQSNHISNNLIDYVVHVRKIRNMQELVDLEGNSLISDIKEFTVSPIEKCRFERICKMKREELEKKKLQLVIENSAPDEMNVLQYSVAEVSLKEQYDREIERINNINNSIRKMTSFNGEHRSESSDDKKFNKTKKRLIQSKIKHQEKAQRLLLLMTDKNSLNQEGSNVKISTLQMKDGEQSSVFYSNTSSSKPSQSIWDEQQNEVRLSMSTESTAELYQQNQSSVQATESATNLDMRKTIFRKKANEFKNSQPISDLYLETSNSVFNKMPNKMLILDQTELNDLHHTLNQMTDEMTLSNTGELHPSHVSNQDTEIVSMDTTVEAIAITEAGNTLLVHQSNACLPPVFNEDQNNTSSLLETNQFHDNCPVSEVRVATELRSLYGVDQQLSTVTLPNSFDNPTTLTARLLQLLDASWMNDNVIFNTIIRQSFLSILSLIFKPKQSSQDIHVNTNILFKTFQMMLRSFALMKVLVLVGIVWMALRLWHSYTCDSCTCYF